MESDPTKIDIKFDPREQRMSGVTAHGNYEFDVPFISEIAPNLWQGGCQYGLVLPRMFRHLVSLYPWEQYKVDFPLDTYVSVRMFDSLRQSTDQIVALAQLVNTCRKTGPVLVHCQAGLNRSSLVVAQALVLEGITGIEAIKLLQEKRSPACLSNGAFFNHVKRLGKD